MPNAAVDDGHAELTVAAIDLLRQAELDGKRAGIAGLGIFFKHHLAVDRGGDVQLGPAAAPPPARWALKWATTVWPGP